MCCTSARIFPLVYVRKENARKTQHCLGIDPRGGLKSYICANEKNAVVGIPTAGPRRPNPCSPCRRSTARASSRPPPGSGASRVPAGSSGERGHGAGQRSASAVVVARRFADASRSVVRSRTRFPKRWNAGPTWAPQGAIQCRTAVIAMSCGQTPRRRHVGPHRTGWGLSSVERRGGCRAGPLGTPSGDRAKPPACMTPPSRGALRCSGAGGDLPGRADHRGAGNRGAPKPGSRPLSDNDTPQPPHGTASAKASRAILQHCCGSARLA